MPILSVDSFCFAKLSLTAFQLYSHVDLYGSFQADNKEMLNYEDFNIKFFGQGFSFCIWFALYFL